MPRKKREPVVEKTPLELALEEAPAPKPKRTRKTKAKTETTKKVEEPAKGVSRPKRQKIESVPKKDFTSYVPPKMKFSRKRIRYTEGDIVEINEAEGKFVGTLRSILASQLVVEDDEGRTRWFFQSGIQIRRLKKGAQKR